MSSIERSSGSFEDLNVSKVDGTDSGEMSLQSLENEIPVDTGQSIETPIMSENAEKLATTDTTAGEIAKKMSVEDKVDRAIVYLGKGAITAVGMPIAVLGKLTGGAISGFVGGVAGVAGLCGAGVGFIISGGKKEGALKGLDTVAFPVAEGVGLALTPLNAIAKFVENFGKALMAKDTTPKVYDKFNRSFKTNIYPHYINIGKEAVEHSPGTTRANLSGKVGRAIKKEEDKNAQREREKEREKELKKGDLGTMAENLLKNPKERKEK